MKETRSWYCDICDKISNVKSKSKPFNFKTHIHKKKYGSLLKEYENVKPKKDDLEYILDNIIK